MAVADPAPGFWYDEAVNGVDARMVLSGAGLPLYFAANYGREPLFIYLQTLAVALLGYRAFALQFVSAGIGVLTVAAVYACALTILEVSAYDPHASVRHPRDPGHDRVALPPAPGPAACRHANESARWSAVFAAAGVTVSFWALSLSRLGLRAVMLPLVSAIAMAFFWRAWTRGRWRDHALAGLWFALALYTYTAARACPSVPLAFVLVEAVLCAVRRGGGASISGAEPPHEKSFPPAKESREARVPNTAWPFAPFRAGRERGAGGIMEALWPGCRPRAARLGLLAGVALLATAPLAVTALREPDVVLGRPTQVSLWAPPPGGGPAMPLQRLETNALLVARNFYDRGDTNPRQNLPGRPVNDPLLALLFSLGLIVSLLRIRQPALPPGAALVPDHAGANPVQHPGPSCPEVFRGPAALSHFVCRWRGLDRRARPPNQALAQVQPGASQPWWGPSGPHGATADRLAGKRRADRT